MCCIGLSAKLNALVPCDSGGAGDARLRHTHHFRHTLAHVTMDNSHAAASKENYKSYWRTLKEWIELNMEDACENGQVSVEAIRQLVRRDTKNFATRFRSFCACQKHRSLRNDDGTPADICFGSLAGFRAAFGYYVWKKYGVGVPTEWTAEMKQYFIKGLKRRERERKRESGG